MFSGGVGGVYRRGPEMDRGTSSDWVENKRHRIGLAESCSVISADEPYCPTHLLIEALLDGSVGTRLERQP